MSWPALKWARKQVVGSASSKSVLIILALFTNEDGYCWPSQETIAEEAELSVDTVQRALKNIVPRFAERTKRKSADGRRISDVYRLNVGDEAVASALAAPCRLDDRSEVMSSTRTAYVSSAKPQADQSPPGGMRPKYTNIQNEDSLAFGETVGGRRLQTKIGKAAFQSWFSAVRFVGQQGNILQLEARSQFIASRIEEWYDADIVECFRVDNEGAVRVKVSVRSSAP